MKDLKQLIKIAEAHERDPASLDRAIEIYEEIINEHDYSHYSTVAEDALNRIEKDRSGPTRNTKRERSKIERVFFRLAILFYAASLVLPVYDQFFMGAKMIVFSAFGAIWMFPKVISQIPSDPKAALDLLTLFLPFYNILFLVALTRFWEAGYSRFSVFRVCFYTCTVLSLTWSVKALFTNFERSYILGLWAAAFLLLSLAIAICTEKNLANEDKEDC